ncbi:DUF3182 family protein [Aquabacter sp. L1I39]|uniref:DUF3182 family protein n=1 Tax=Aquabacter sp. L1I39 TaxID=2820278 RepID=UPI001ADC5C2D|nr:DUF3182 family protein [Aquabacter sp. L1I39]QTL02122.1 DUF3182 family protein [Aquabacter sp. L1I39]
MNQSGHRSRSIAALAQALAPLAGRGLRKGERYLVPDLTLGAAEAERLGVLDEDDLFGGVVPHDVVAGKAIVHPLPSPGCAHPKGWSADFAQAVMAHALPGFSAFTNGDARTALYRLLAHGPVRLKPGWADGGLQQHVVHDALDAEAIISRLPQDSLAASGLVLETNLSDVTTFSVGRVRIGGHEIAYVGTQHATQDNDGNLAYGGSRLLCARGGFSAFARATLSPQMAQALEQARVFDAAADHHFSGFFASRRNYDVAIGRDARGTLRSGVLEQSWRIGGASGAEIAALRAFAGDDDLRFVVASCHEVYGRAESPPEEADVYYDADDPEVGTLTKYALVESRSHAE